MKSLKGQPDKMWAKLKEVHLQKKPGARFNAYDGLFAIRKQENESLTTLMARVVNCTGNPRVFFAVPLPLPTKTRTLIKGMGFMVGFQDCTQGYKIPVRVTGYPWVTTKKYNKSLIYMLAIASQPSASASSSPSISGCTVIA